MYYVYIMKHPDSLHPFYIGKGSGNRMYVHEKRFDKPAEIKLNPLKTAAIRAIKTEGKDIVYERIECDTEHAALTLEMSLIEQYGRKCFGTGILTNISPGGTIAKSPPPVHQYSLAGSFLRTFNTMKEASTDVGVGVSGIQSAANPNGHIKSAAGYLWSYEKVDKLPQWSHDLHTRVTQYDKTGAVIATFNTIAEAGAVTGVDRGNISACADKKLKTAGGYVWRHGDDEFSLDVHKGSKAVMQLDKNTEHVIATYSSATEAQRITGINAANISGCCSGKPKTAGGYKWKKVA